MIVADASALFQVISWATNAAAIEARLFARAEPICVPHLVDAEIANILRRHVLAGRVDEARATQLLHDFMDFALLRFSHTLLLPRVFSLRDRVSAYDALYVALAESLSATLITCDGRLARAVHGTIIVEAF